MNVPQLTPEELKTLNLFSYYCRSYGADIVYRTFYLSACSKDWEDDKWYSRDINGGIEGYDRIDELIDKLIDNDAIINEFTECDGSQRIEVEIDCKEKFLIMYAYQTVYGSEPHGSDYTLEDIESEYGEESVKELTKSPKNIGFFLPTMHKDELFKYVLSKGALPKKTFSMGEADEKRFYLECRKIVL